MNQVGKRIHALRKRRGWSQEELADNMGVSRLAVGEIERGKRKVSAEELVQLAKLFATSVDYILGLTAEPVVSIEKAPPRPKQKKAMRINVPQKNVEKFKEVLLYVLSRVGAQPNVGEMVVYKLLYFIDFDYYERYEEQLTGATYMKNHFGPTPLEFKEIVERMLGDGDLDAFDADYFGYLQRKYLPRRDPHLEVLNAREVDLINDVLDRLSAMTGKQISEYSHGDIPWMTAQDGEIINYEAVFYRTPAYSVRAEEEADEVSGS